MCTTLFESSLENSLASAARSDDKIKFEKLKLDERSIVLRRLPPLNISHIAIVILDVFNVQCACNHVNDVFFGYPDRAKRSIKRNECKIQSMMHAKANLENSIPSIKCISMFCCVHQNNQ